MRGLRLRLPLRLRSRRPLVLRGLLGRRSRMYLGLRVALLLLPLLTFQLLVLVGAVRVAGRARQWDV